MVATLSGADGVPVAEPVSGMREFETRCRCGISAHGLWKLRRNFETDQWIARQEDRDVQLVEETESIQDGEPMVERKTSCRLMKNPIPQWLRGIIKEDALQTNVSAKWYINSFDKEHPYSFSVEVPSFKDKVQVTGTQWLEKETEGTCFVCSMVSVVCTAPAIGGHVESMFEKQFRESYENYPTHVASFVREVHSDKDTFVEEPREPEHVPQEHRSNWKCSMWVGGRRIGFQTEYTTSIDEVQGVCCCCRLVSWLFPCWASAEMHRPKGMAKVRLREECEVVGVL